MSRPTFARLLASALLTPIVITMTTTPAAAQDAALSTPQAQASYAIGQNIGSSMLEDGIVLDEAAFARGLKDAMTGAKSALTEEQAEAAIRQMQIEMATRRSERIAAVAKTNAEEGEAFLKTNAAKPGIVTTASGLQYQVITEGAGPKPTAASVVSTRYRGTLINGTEFDSSGESPVSFPVGGVIPGWTEALQLMGVGAKWRLFVPSELAYGGRGASAEIGPNATLVFEVELVSIQ